MPNLDWISDPGVKAQSTVGDIQYYVTFPSVMLNLADPDQSFSEPKQYMASALKKTADGIPINYIVGHGFNNVQQAQTACQQDLDKYGDTIPPDKMPSLPSEIVTRKRT